MTSPAIRPETPHDRAAIREVNRLAFETDEEADLVDRLREDGAVLAWLVAVEGDLVVGHILFSRLAVETGRGTVWGAALAPMAVRPERQRRGVGSALVRKGVAVCAALGCPFVLVVGHPEYYPRFGFRADAARNLEGPVAGEAWMALELAPGALQGVSGRMRYPRAFGLP